MFLCTVTGKLSEVSSLPASGEEAEMNWATISERRYSAGVETFVKHFVHMKPYNVAFAKKCADKGWTVTILATDPREVLNEESRLDGYMLQLDLLSIQM